MPKPSRPEMGMSLVELLVALVVLSVGVLALGRLFPSANRTQEQAKMNTTAVFFAQEKLEQLSSVAWADTALSVGRHPSGTATEGLGNTGRWRRFYQVDAMAAPLDDLKKVTVTVSWTYQGNRTTSTTTYLRR